jgi:hypothetical protein
MFYCTNQVEIRIEKYVFYAIDFRNLYTYLSSLILKQSFEHCLLKNIPNKMETIEMLNSVLTGLSSYKELLSETGISEGIKSVLVNIKSFTKDLFTSNQVANEVLNKFEQVPSDQVNKGMLLAFMQTELAAEKEKLSELKKLVDELNNKIREDKKAESIFIKNSKNVVTGGISNISGNVSVGDQS